MKKMNTCPFIKEEKMISVNRTGLIKKDNAEK